MSVIKAKRKPSRFEVLVHANNLHDMMLELMQRNYGVKDVKHLVRKKYLFSKEQEDQYAFYRVVLNQSKDHINHFCRLLIANIRAANTIYARSTAEFEQRREYQNDAIVNCEQIKAELMRIVTVFDVDVNIYAQYLRAIHYEVELIKNWRQRDNKLKFNFNN